MPITTSAKKALRVSRRKRVFNLRRKGNMDAAIKNIKKLVSQKNLKDARTALQNAYKAIDKAAKGGIIKKNNAARKKSRLSKFIKRVS
jgi:small subunit ribosomal protein S20